MRATWTLTIRRRSIAADGTAVLRAELADRGVKQGDLLLTMTARRELRVEWQGEPGSEPLADFQAWSTL